MNGHESKDALEMAVITRSGSKWASLFSGVLMLAGLSSLTGCDTEAFCFSCGEDGVAAGGQGSGGKGGAGGALGLGGNAGNGGGLQVGCNASINLQTDPQNCGSCDNVCAKPTGAIPACQAGKCTFSCAPGFYDLDGKPENGCEVGCNGSTTAKELCDGVDNDCDGLVDEGFDLQKDAANCGGCGNKCGFSNGDATCVAGKCVLAQCKTGFYDNALSPAADCDYACDPSNGGKEICDGKDNDCNGKPDDVSAATLATDAANCGACGKSCVGTIPGATAKCDAGKCALDACLPGFANTNGDPKDGCEYACEAKCSFPFAVPICGPNALCSMGACLPNYYDLDKATPNGCEYFCVQTNGGVELCDLLDNDCDGKVDEDPDVSSDPLNCGACGKNCDGTFLNMLPVCAAAQCAPGACNPGYLDKDGDPLTGCEFNCATLCAFPFAASQCDVVGNCSMGVCELDHYDLDGSPANGCEYTCTKTSDVEKCDGKDNDCDGLVDEEVDVNTDPLNCGACFASCSGKFANAKPTCETGSCVFGTCVPGYLDKDGDPNNGCEYSCEALCKFPFAVSNCDVIGNCSIGPCQPGYVDLDAQAANGCEYACSPTNNGVELCDLVDNDCDGDVDEGVDTTDDPENCGACGLSCEGSVLNASAKCSQSKCIVDVCDPGYFDSDNDPTNGCEFSCEATCAFPGGTGSCSAEGVCTFGQCLPGFANLDNNLSNGCEYSCPVNPTSPEVCDGLDNDCDGVIDDAAEIAPQKPAAALCKPTPGTPCAGADFVCKGLQGWKCNYGPGVETANGVLLNDETLCDGIDGNCNGTKDESFGVGATCDNNKLGACRDAGVIACDPADKSRVLCDLTPLPNAVPGAPLAEACNGVDDDCNGVVDEGIVDDMVQVGAVFIDRYESSRPDATASNAGLLENRACVKAGVLPWTQASYAEAKAACEGRGARLCTSAELTAACEGGTAGKPYPYGASYSANACNGEDYDGLSGGTDDDIVVPTGLASCASANGIYDLSGNVAEWTSTLTGNTGAPANLPIYITKGGSYLTPAVGLTCQFDLSRSVSTAITVSLGFRCCK